MNRDRKIDRSVNEFSESGRVFDKNKPTSKIFNKRGFTIIEISIVLITIGILAILAKNYLMSNVETTRFNTIRSDLDRATQRLFQDIKNNNWMMPHPVPTSIDNDTVNGIEYTKGDESLPAYTDSFGKQYIVYSDYAHMYNKSRPLDVCTTHHSGIGKNRYTIVYPNNKEVRVSFVMIPKEYEMFYVQDSSDPFRIIANGNPGDIVKVKVDGSTEDVVNNSYIKHYTHMQMMDEVDCPRFSITPSSVANVPLMVDSNDFEVQIRSANSGIVDWCVEVDKSKRKQVDGGVNSSMGLRTLPNANSLDRSQSFFDEVNSATSPQNRCPNSTFPAVGFGIWFSKPLPYTYTFTVYAYDNRTDEGLGLIQLEKKIYSIGVINP